MFGKGILCKEVHIGVKKNYIKNTQVKKTKPVLGSGVICVFGLKKGILREETKEITHPPETVVSDGVKIKKTHQFPTNRVY